MSTVQKYTSKSVGELTQTLVTLVDAKTGEGITSELREWVYMLKVHKLRHRSDAHAFFRNGGVEALGKLVSRCDLGRDLVLLLGTMGNLCALDKNIRDAVMVKSLVDIVSILNSSSDSDVLNTCVRVLANLALDEENIAVLLEKGIIARLCDLLARDRYRVNSGCKRSLLRAMRLLSLNSDCREEMKSNDGIKAVVECVKADCEELAMAAIHTLEAVTQYCDPDVVQPLSNKPAIQAVIRFCSHREESVRKKALSVSLNCTKCSNGRMALSGAGGVEMLVGHMESTADRPALFNEVVRAVCVCCRDVVGRQRLRDCGGLERLVNFLSKTEYSSLHSNIMSALVCYYFDENTLNSMVKRLGLIKALTFHLKEMTKKIDFVDDSNPEYVKKEANIDNKEPQDANYDYCHGNDGDDDDQMECIEEIAYGSSSQSETESASSRLTGFQEENPSPLPSQTLSNDDTFDTPKKLSFQEETSKSGSSSTSCSIPPSSSSSLDSSSNEMLADETPPPAKRRKLQIDLDTSTPMPANFLDTLLSSPNPYQNQPKASIESTSPFSSDSSSPLETQVVIMLSRVSHLRDCLKNLASPEILLTILDYFVSCSPPNVHVFKVLTRIFTNPHCFQECLASLIPSRIYELLRQPSELNESFSFESLHLLISSPLSPTAIQSPLGSQSLSVFRSMCNELLERLSKIAVSPYGQGVLAHLLLRGEEKEKQASCLTLPLLCRSPRLCQRMMLGYGGFKLLCNLTQSEEDIQLQTMALDSLLALAHTMQKKVYGHNSKINQGASLEGITIQVQPTTNPPQLDSSFGDLSLSEETLTAQLSTPSSSKKTYCRYHDTDHYPFDLTISVHSESSGDLTVHVHKAILVEFSDVFAVMLAGQYLESDSKEVTIQDIPPLAVLSLIHHIYGCGWQCPTVMNMVTQKEFHYHEAMEESPVDAHTLSSFTTDVIISQIVATFDDQKDQKKVQHCLQVLACAGRFLLSELATLCEHAAVRYLCPDNMVIMFQFAQLHKCYCLAESCIRTLFSLPHSLQRTEVFKNLMESSEREAALEIITMFLSIADYCSPSYC